MANHFGDRLVDAIKSKRTPLIVGLDPVYSRLPAAITSRQDMNDEFDVDSAVDAIFDYCTQVLRIVAPMVPAVKINIAFFEKYLWQGVESYYSLISEANELGIEVIGDVKRGDIGHTAEAYAAAHLENPGNDGPRRYTCPGCDNGQRFRGRRRSSSHSRILQQSRARAYLYGFARATPARL